MSLLLSTIERWIDLGRRWRSPVPPLSLDCREKNHSRYFSNVFTNLHHFLKHLHQHGPIKIRCTELIQQPSPWLPAAPDVCFPWRCWRSTAPRRCPSPWHRGSRRWGRCCWGLGGSRMVWRPGDGRRLELEVEWYSLMIVC